MDGIYFLSGSPCSGKSTVADLLHEEYGIALFHCDDGLDRYVREGAAMGFPICAKQATLSPEEIWMRPPALQCREEIAFYREVFAFTMRDLRSLPGPVLAEGAGFLPTLLSADGIPPSRVFVLTPDKQFQIRHYRARTWVPMVLKDCRDKEAAFRNWMERDALFAAEVRSQGDDAGYPQAIADGSVSPEDTARRIAAHFGF